jgi:hypothetical protein
MRSYWIIAILLVLLVACNKDKDLSESASASLRIKEIYNDYEGDNNDWKTTFAYEGENLAGITEFEKDDQGIFTESYRAEITYDGNRVIMTWFYYNNGSWETEGKYEIVVENGHLSEETYLDYVQAQWVEEWRWVYQYSGSNLVAWQSFDNGSTGALEQDGRAEYFYNNGLLSEYKSYRKNSSGDYIQFDMETFSYSGNDLISWIDFDRDESNNWVETDKCEYTYGVGTVSVAEYFDWDDNINTWETEPFSEFYTYNPEGLVTEWSNDDGDRITYEYEKGAGNAKLLWYYPEDLVYGEPTFKNAARRDRMIPYYRRTGPGKLIVP